MTPLESIKEFYGEETRTSDWYLVEQSTIDKFGEATGDIELAKQEYAAAIAAHKAAEQLVEKLRGGR